MRPKIPILILVGILFVTVSFPAFTDPWIPAAGEGKLKAVVRWYQSHRVFSSSHYGTQTFPSTSKYTETQLKVTGEHGLGNGWALRYDLRAAELRKAKKKNTYTASGLEDQTLGLVYGLHQTPSFADALAFNVVFPTGSTTSHPQLGVGEYAVEPDYQIGVKRRYGDHHYVTGTLTLGPRVFLDGGATQLRASLDVGTNVSSKVAVFGSLFYVHTVAGYNPPPTGVAIPNNAEIYNLLRGGIALQYALTKNVRPILGYEVDLAGRDIHAGHRIVLGVSWRY